MKKQSIFALALAGFTFTAITGCGAGNLLFKQTPVLVAPAATNVVATVATNTTTVTNFVTNAISGAVNSQLTFETTLTTNLQPVIHPAIYYTNVAIADGFADTVKIGGAAATVAGVPLASMITNVVLGLGTVFLAYVSNTRKNKALAEAAGHAQTKSALATAQIVGETLVENFETLRGAALSVPGYTREIDDKVMSFVQTAQALAGKEVKSTIHDLVETKTDMTHPGDTQPAK